MVAVTDKTQHLLTMQTAEIAPNTTAIRSLDWNRRRHRIRSAKWHHIQLISNSGFAMRFS